MATFGTLEQKQFEQGSNVEKVTLWQKVTDECADVAADDLTNTRYSRGRPCNLPFLPPGSRSGASSASTGWSSSGWSSSRASSRCSSVYSARDSSAGSVQSSRAASTARGRARPSKTRGASSCAGTDLPSASTRSKVLPRDAVHRDDEEAPQVENIETHPKKPSAPPTEQVLPPLVGTAWQDPADVGKLSQMVERERFNCTPTDSRPASALSNVDDVIFGSSGVRLYTSGFDHLPKEIGDSFGDQGLFQASGPMIPTPPASTRENVERPVGRRKLLPPMSLEVAEAAANAALSELTRSALSGHAPDTAAPPSVKEAWSAPEQPQGPPPANRFTRPAFRQRSGWNADAETSSETTSVDTKLSL